MYKNDSGFLLLFDGNARLFLTAFFLLCHYNGGHADKGDSMTVIYIDTLFFLNAVIDYLLLLAAARLAGEPLRRFRFAIGAGIGGIYAVALFLPGFSFLSHPVYKVVFMGLMLLVSYGQSRRFVRQGLIFLALTCAFGGGIAALGMFGGRELN